MQSPYDVRGRPALVRCFLGDCKVVPVVSVVEKDQDLVGKGRCVCVTEWYPLIGTKRPEMT